MKPKSKYLTPISFSGEVDLQANLLKAGIPLSLFIVIMNMPGFV